MNTVMWNLAWKKLTIHKFAMALILMTYFESAGYIGIASASIPSRERQFGLSSIVSGILAMCFDLGFVICTLSLAYYGAKSFTKPKWCAFGAILISLSYVLLCLPTFLSPDYKVNFSDEHSQCSTVRNISFCTSTGLAKDSSSKTYVFLLIIGFTMLGMGNIPQNTVAIQYIEENSNLGGFYFGIMQLFRSIGGISGAIIAAITLQIPVNLRKLPVDNDHLLWVGAYWIGFLIMSFAVAVFIPILFVFPKSFRKVESIANEVEKDIPVHDNDDFLLQIQKLLTNMSFVFMNITSVTESIVFSGFLSFATKYFQTILGFSSNTASLGLAVLIIAAALGSIIGAVCSKFKNEFSTLVFALIGLSTLQILAGHFVFFTCDSHKVVGIFLDYNKKSTSNFELDAPCNTNCHCDEELFQPVCDTDVNVAFYSGCYAGCNADNTNCSCLTGTLKQGTCNNICTNMYLNLALTFIFVICMVGKVPLGIAASIKIIKVEHTSVAMALINFAQRCFGMMPGPLIFGVVFDWSCILWQKSCKDSEGSCLLIDQTRLSWYVYAVIMFCCIIPIIFYSLSYFVELKKYEVRKNDIKGVDNPMTVSTETTSIQSSLPAAETQIVT